MRDISERGAQNEMEAENKPKARSNATLINRKAPSKHSPVYAEQAKFLAILARDLIDEYRMTIELEGKELDLSEFFIIPAYIRFLHGAYACGFVCRDFTPDFPIDAMLIRPRESLSALSFHQLRHYVHTLLRAERWADGYSSPIRSALDAGTVEALHDRLLNDDTLYEPF